MHKEGLGRVLAGPETAPLELEDGAPPGIAHTRYDRLKNECDDKNDTLPTRFLVATVGSSEGFSSATPHKRFKDFRRSGR